MAQKYKEEGNQHYKNQNWQKALICYHKVFLYINGLISKEDEFAFYSQVNYNNIIIGVIDNIGRDQCNQRVEMFDLWKYGLGLYKLIEIHKRKRGSY